ncbi:glycoside hydrolase family 97 N-terminal domain-containing protein [Flavobacterium sp. LS1R49]|uniref:Glycoside hydrolase family 97 N-terminal domain-containing protein n=1 Tax=Flavobacterium shii TaxID=2987687 RepID=A0A9X2ZDP7_9FLAO|nr:glycoside hydrolase family 97 N-terminal domain-containing protein [Flavobacterium shii]MCV9929476.1 glycoside hydrolase family 97 N-terminal domain-containing protein [Flavobacterium shii]
MVIILYVRFLLKLNENLSTDFEIKSVRKSTFDETWGQFWGEKNIGNHYNQLVVEIQKKSGKQTQIGD